MPISWPASTTMLASARERLDRVARDEPRRLQAVPLEQLEQPRRPDLAGEQAARDVVRASSRRRTSRASRPPRRRRRRTRQRISLAMLHLPVRWYERLFEHVRALRGAARSEHWAETTARPARPRVPRRAARPGARPLRPPARDWAGRMYVLRGRQGPRDGGRRTSARSGRRRSASPAGRSTRSTPSSWSRSRSCKTPVVARHGLPRERQDDADLARCSRSPELGETAVIVNELGEIGIDHHLLQPGRRAHGAARDRLPLLHAARRSRGRAARPARPARRGRDPAVPARRRRDDRARRPGADRRDARSRSRVVRHHFELDARRRDRRRRSTGSRGAGVDEAGGGRRRARRDEDRPRGRRRRRAAELGAAEPGGDVVEAVARGRRARAAPRVGGAATAAMPASGRRPPTSTGTATRATSRGRARRSTSRSTGLGFGVWLTMLLQARGRGLLRVKGLLDVGGDGPLLLNAVQHVVHPPVHLDAWPDDDRRSRLVLIGRGLDARPRSADRCCAFNRAG